MGGVFISGSSGKVGRNTALPLTSIHHIVAKLPTAHEGRKLCEHYLLSTPCLLYRQSTHVAVFEMILAITMLQRQCPLQLMTCLASIK